MKRTALFSIFILLLTIIFPACKEDIYIDWKLLNDKALADTVEKYKDNKDFFSTASGLSYKVIYNSGHPKKPDAATYILVSYTAKLIDGSVFESGTFDNSNSPEYLPGSIYISGFQEAVKKMPVGSKFIFYIPSPLGYDTISTNPKIPPYSTLIFEVNLDSTN